METNVNTSGVSFKRALVAGFTTGIIIALVNNLDSFFCATSLHISAPGVIGFSSITGVSLVASLLAGIGYWVITRFCSKSTAVFGVVVLVLTALSLAGPLQPTLPDGLPKPAGFALLTIPMHLIAGLLIAYFIPRLANP